MKHFLLFFICVAGIYSFQAQVTVNPPSPLEVCDENNNGIALFDLTTADAQIIGGQSNVDVFYYNTMADASNGGTPISTPSNYFNGSPYQETVWARAESTLNADYAVVDLELYVNPLPDSMTPNPIVMVDADSDGYEIFDLTTNETFIMNGEPGVYVAYFGTLYDAETGQNALVNPVAYQNVETPEETIYVRVEDNSTGCYIIVEQLLIIDTVPNVPPTVEDFAVFDADGNGIATFDLTLKIPEITGGQSDWEVTFYVTASDAENNANPIEQPEAYVNITNPQTIYVRVETQYGAHSTTSFVIFADENLNVSTYNFSDLKVYPIPTSEKITVQSGQLSSQAHLVFYDMHGKSLLSKKATPQNGVLSVDISSLATGVYYIKITSGNQTTYKKLIKK